MTPQVGYRVLAAMVIGLAAVALMTGCSRSDTPTRPNNAAVSSDPAPRSAVSARMNASRVRSTDPDWRSAQAEVYADQQQLAHRLAGLSNQALRGHVLRAGNPRRWEVALTFDDGPHPRFTPKLLRILREQRVHATFFVVGFMADRYPELVKAIAADGHAVGNHTYSHPNLTKLSKDEVLVEWEADNRVIERLTGVRPRYCRPPGGDFNSTTLRAAAALGLTVVLWTDDPADYSNPGDVALMRREIRALRRGAIVLLHDGSQDTVDTLAAFIEAVRRRGFEFVTLDRLRQR